MACSTYCSPRTNLSKNFCKPIAWKFTRTFDSPQSSAKVEFVELPKKEFTNASRFPLSSSTWIFFFCNMLQILRAITATFVRSERLNVFNHCFLAVGHNLKKNGSVSELMSCVCMRCITCSVTVRLQMTLLVLAASSNLHLKPFIVFGCDERFRSLASIPVSFLPSRSPLWRFTVTCEVRWK